MRHIIFLFYITCLVSGIPAIVFVGQLIFKQKAPFLKYYLALILSAFMLVLVDCVFAYMLAMKINIPLLPIAHFLFAAPAETAVVLTVIMSSVATTRYKLDFKIIVALAILAVIYFSLLVCEYIIQQAPFSLFMDILFISVLTISIGFSFVFHIKVRSLKIISNIFSLVSFVMLFLMVAFALFLPSAMFLTLTLYFCFWSITTIVACIALGKKVRAPKYDLPEMVDISKKYGITPSEWRIIELLATSYDTTEIASVLDIKKQVVWNTISSLYKKTGTSSRIGLLNLLREIH